MAKDKYTAVWVSHSSISDFLKCPRAYYLKNVYKDTETGHKIALMNPSLALGQAVHEVIEALSILPAEKRFNEPLTARFEAAWKKIGGKKGGFRDKDNEACYKNRGMIMLQRVTENPGPLVNLAVKIKMKLPHFWLSKQDNIILCGRIDWLEYLPETDSVHIIDFKTGKNHEDPKSLQLPIYHLLVHHCQKRNVIKASYWYLETSDTPTETSLPDIEEARRKVLRIAKQIKQARRAGHFVCPHKNSCYACRPLEAIISGDAEFVGVNEFKQDVYVIDDSFPAGEETSVIL